MLHTLWKERSRRSVNKRMLKWLVMRKMDQKYEGGIAVGEDAVGNAPDECAEYVFGISL
jgi:hypothetical protein